MGSLTLTATQNSQLYSSLRRPAAGRGGGAPARVGFRVMAYIERPPNSVASIASKVLGSLPVVGLIARIFSDEGGVAGDTIDFAEFRRRVGKKCGVTDSRAFYELQERRGRAGEPLYVLLCCWLAAVGAGLLKSEEILEGVARLRISNDIEYEEQNFLDMMKTAKERRAKSKAPTPEIPMEIRVEKALEAIYTCCFGKDPIEVEDVRLLRIILSAVFPTVAKPEIDRIVNGMVRRIAENKKVSYPEKKILSKEAKQRQMKDLEFLQQKTEFLKKVKQVNFSLQKQTIPCVKMQSKSHTC